MKFFYLTELILFYPREDSDDSGVIDYALGLNDLDLEDESGRALSRGEDDGRDDVSGSGSSDDEEHRSGDGDDDGSVDSAQWDVLAGAESGGGVGGPGGRRGPAGEGDCGSDDDDDDAPAGGEGVEARSAGNLPINKPRGRERSENVKGIPSTSGRPEKQGRDAEHDRCQDLV